jgi:DNA topoisomerase-1
LYTIFNGEEWTNICKNCYNEIKTLSKPIQEITKEKYDIDGEHIFTFNKFGPVIEKKCDNGEIQYISVKKDIHIDIEKLKQKEYSLEELIEIQNNCLGKYDGEDVFIKKGRFGNYIEWGDKKESIKSINKPINEITMKDVFPILSNELIDGENNNNKILRILNENLSIRSGKYGSYIFYKKTDMKKPKFLNIKKCPEEYLICDTDVLLKWIEKTYNV